MATRMTPEGVVVKSTETRTAMSPFGFVIKHVEEAVGGRIMSSLAGAGGLAGKGGIAGAGGGLAG